jgi:hypothetical protein
VGLATRDDHGPVMSKKQAFLFPFQGRGQVEYSHADTVDGIGKRLALSSYLRKAID